ncbi:MULTISPECIES: YajQ family cyclic di-GMP-binding protein [unclassified Hahella]|uniref:YajQ family cyclic di-GMP-binding protein n=1 Tax=unclassified Hahella TaxID=2624107 RepID=UPI001C1F1F4B|nr:MULTISPECIES: YajQ family cyclic di-GMP-binding protein [unclassified Hahella]MBU6952196.1 YajQ family cyclic di-GMP-binding protein [Hahella sp. HN01]MDG9667540.1 YajQ family cyclic di-GMP-binding protein [Hahella sp. CR1]
MPSFDIVSEIDRHELTNAVDQANRELEMRYDFRGVEASFTLAEKAVEMAAEQEFQLEQMLLILNTTLSKRKVDLRVLGDSTDQKSGKQVKRSYALKEGLEQKVAKDIVKKIKESKMKVQASIQGDQVRITGKKRDDLQEAIQLLRGDESLDVPMQFNNFRD